MWESKSHAFAAWLHLSIVFQSRLIGTGFPLFLFPLTAGTLCFFLSRFSARAFRFLRRRTLLYSSRFFIIYIYILNTTRYFYISSRKIKNIDSTLIRQPRRKREGDFSSLPLVSKYASSNAYPTLSDRPQVCSKACGRCSSSSRCRLDLKYRHTESVYLRAPASPPQMFQPLRCICSR